MCSLPGSAGFIPIKELGLKHLPAYQRLKIFTMLSAPKPGPSLRLPRPKPLGPRRLLFGARILVLEIKAQRRSSPRSQGQRWSRAPRTAFYCSRLWPAQSAENSTLSPAVVPCRLCVSPGARRVPGKGRKRRREARPELTFHFFAGQQRGEERGRAAAASPMPPEPASACSHRALRRGSCAKERSVGSGP